MLELMVAHGFIFLTAKKRDQPGLALGYIFLKKKQPEQGTQSKSRMRVSCVRTRTACQQSDSVIDFLIAEEIIISIIERSIILNSLVDWGSFFLVQDD
jgi:hypothetical protein